MEANILSLMETCAFSNAVPLPAKLLLDNSPLHEYFDDVNLYDCC